MIEQTLRLSTSSSTRTTHAVLKQSQQSTVELKIVASHRTVEQEIRDDRSTSSLGAIKFPLYPFPTDTYNNCTLMKVFMSTLSVEISQQQIKPRTQRAIRRNLASISPHSSGKPYHGQARKLNCTIINSGENFRTMNNAMSTFTTSKERAFFDVRTNKWQVLHLKGTQQEAIRFSTDCITPLLSQMQVTPPPPFTLIVQTGKLEGDQTYNLGQNSRTTDRAFHDACNLEERARANNCKPTMEWQDNLRAPPLTLTIEIQGRISQWL